MLFYWYAPFWVISIYAIFENYPTCTRILDVAADVVAAGVTWRAVTATFAMELIPFPVADVSAPLRNLVYFEYAYYAAFTMIEALGHKANKRVSLLHHACSLALISLCHAFHFYHLMGAFLCLFNTSTPFLDLARLGRHLRIAWLEHGAFACFTLSFFAGRVCGVPLLVWKCYHPLHPATFGYRTSYVVAWLFAKGGLGTLYAMQLVWCKRIVSIWKEKLLHPHIRSNAQPDT